MKKVVSVIVAGLLLAGCGPVRGQITNKTYTPAYSITTIMSCGKGCMMPVTTYYPECYGITVENKMSKCIRQGLWESLPVGSYYDDEKMV